MARGRVEEPAAAFVAAGFSRAGFVFGGSTGLQAREYRVANKGI